MKRDAMGASVGVVALASLMVCTGRASAAEGASEKRPAKQPPTWMLAAGIDFSPITGGALGTPPVGAAPPNVALMLERRLTRSVWLMARIDAGYSSGEGSSKTVGGDGETQSEGNGGLAGGALGLRYVFTPDDPFQVSTFGTVGAHYARFDAESTTTGAVAGSPGGTQESEAIDTVGRLGLSLDRELVEGLGLRLSAVFVQGGWIRSIQTTTVGNARSESASSGWQGGVTIDPSIELRFAF